MYLLPALFFCHFLADYTHLSTPWMLRAKSCGSPVFPILCHGLVHGVLMFIVCLGYTNIFNTFLVFSFQTVSHTLIDIAKGRIQTKYVGLQSTKNVWHWVLFGADQFLHQIVIILIFYFILYYN